MKKKYAVHEGFVNSKHDKERHFISFERLCDLYGVDPKIVVNWVADGRGKIFEDYIHLYPRYDGNYSLPQ